MEITWHQDSISETNPGPSRKDLPRKQANLTTHNGRSVSGQERSEGALRSRKGPTLERGDADENRSKTGDRGHLGRRFATFCQSRSRINGGISFFADLSAHRIHATIAPSLENRGMMWSQSGRDQRKAVYFDGAQRFFSEDGANDILLPGWSRYLVALRANHQ